MNQIVVTTDVTTITVNRKQNYIRNFSIENTIIYKHTKNGRDFIKTVDMKCTAP